MRLHGELHRVTSQADGSFIASSSSRLFGEFAEEATQKAV